MGTPLLDEKSSEKRNWTGSLSPDLQIVLDRILSQAAGEGVSVALALCRVDSSGASPAEEDKEGRFRTVEGLQGLFSEIAGADWFYARESPHGYLSIVAGKARETVIAEIRHLAETWRNFQGELNADGNQRRTASWGVAFFPEDGLDRTALLRAAEISWRSAKKGAPGSIGGRAPTETLEIELSLSAAQYDCLRRIAERGAVEPNELIAEAVDRLIREDELGEGQHK